MTSEHSIYWECWLIVTLPEFISWIADFICPPERHTISPLSFSVLTASSRRTLKCGRRPDILNTTSPFWYTTWPATVPWLLLAISFPARRLSARRLIHRHPSATKILKSIAVFQRDALDEESVWDSAIKRQNANLIICMADWIVPGHGQPFRVLPHYR